MKVRIVKCTSCFAEYKFELKKTNTYLYVPYRQKDVVREMGAMFDPDLKLWYISAKAPLTIANKILRNFKIVK